ncbi:hypothetical protein EG329_014057 [Mollisiaceae sp. DMI_Dod_QoI]|nr:hypothetical protein EG329_014057 [Helotiales sp. DMI_Dod_QoI]
MIDGGLLTGLAVGYLVKRHRAKRERERGELERLRIEASKPPPYTPPPQIVYIQAPTPAPEPKVDPEEKKRLDEIERSNRDLLKAVGDLKEELRNATAIGTGNPKVDAIKQKLDAQKRNNEPQWRPGPNGRRMEVPQVGRQEQPRVNPRKYGQRAGYSASAQGQ